MTWIPRIRIDRCVCMRMPFERLLPLARREGWNLAALQDATGCGDQCGMCRPYLRAMLADGTTEFHQILDDVLEGEATAR